MSSPFEALDQVAPELPPRVEQTLEVELERTQRKFYDALLDRYRQQGHSARRLAR